MRLCFLADAQNPHTQKWVSHFSRQGHEVHLLTCRPQQIPGVHIHPIRPKLPMAISPAASTLSKFGYLTCLQEVRKEIQRLRPDLLHAHWASSYGLMGAWADYHPFVCSTWGGDVFEFPCRSVLFRQLLKWILSRADAVTATSRVLTKETYKYMPEGQKIETIPFGVDTVLFGPGALKKSNELIIGIVKGLESKYGIDVLIRSFKRVYSRYSHVRLRIVGQGTKENELKKMVRNLGLDEAIQFVGSIQNERVPEYLHEMDIFVVPSLAQSETFGVSAVEAMACSLPVVASNIGGLPEVVVDGVTGFLVPPGDEYGLARRIEDLVLDKNMRIRMGKAGRLFVQKHYQWNENAVKMEYLYSRLLMPGKIR